MTFINVCIMYVKFQLPIMIIMMYVFILNILFKIELYCVTLFWYGIDSHIYDILLNVFAKVVMVIFTVFEITASPAVWDWYFFRKGWLPFKSFLYTTIETLKIIRKWVVKSFDLFWTLIVDCNQELKSSQDTILFQSYLPSWIRWSKSSV